MFEIERLTSLLRGRRVVALTGAGCSTESGIPDYRGPGTLARAKNPIQAREFKTRAEARQRYWARSALGWPRLSSAKPNAAHRALAELEHAACLGGVITQNVDGLHQAAGSRRVVELHGALARVRCLDCGALSSRAELQERLLEQNPELRSQHADLAPDGDSELTGTDGFRVAACATCEGVLKPDVVFFGENVDRSVLERAWQLFDEAEVLLVVGSSLTVFSGYRFVRRAAERLLPVAIVNLGPTRADALSCMRIDERAGRVLPELAAALLVGAPQLSPKMTAIID